MSGLRPPSSGIGATASRGRHRLCAARRTRSTRRCRWRGRCATRPSLRAVPGPAAARGRGAARARPGRPVGGAGRRADRRRAQARRHRGRAAGRARAALPRGADDRPRPGPRPGADARPARPVRQRGSRWCSPRRTRWTPTAATRWRCSRPAATSRSSAPRRRPAITSAADSLDEIYERLAGLGDPAAAWSRRFFPVFPNGRWRLPIPDRPAPAGAGPAGSRHRRTALRPARSATTRRPA